MTCCNDNESFIRQIWSPSYWMKWRTKWPARNWGSSKGRQVAACINLKLWLVVARETEEERRNKIPNQVSYIQRFNQSQNSKAKACSFKAKVREAHAKKKKKAKVRILEAKVRIL